MDANDSLCIDLILRNARALREVGVLKLSLPGWSVEFSTFLELPTPAQLEVPTADDNASDGDEFDPDPLNNPATYGRLSGLPGFIRPPPESDDD